MGPHFKDCMTVKQKEIIMKKVLFAIILLASGAAAASSGAESIYNALNVKEKKVEAALAQMVNDKSVGGLSCVEINLAINEAKYACTLNAKNVDEMAIYSALNVEEKILPAARTELSYEKSVGGLTCVKTNHILNGDSVKCSLSF